MRYDYYSLLIVLFLFNPLNAQQAKAQQVTRGPYLQTLTPSSVIVRWRTDQASASAVRYGTSVSSLSGQVDSSSQVSDHEIVLSNLNANTRYYYTVGTPGSVSSVGTTSQYFETAPAAGTSKATRIWVLGDSGTANSNARAVRDRYKEFAASDPADIVLMLGDNAYSDGTDSEYQDAVFDMYPEVLAKTVLWSTLGNHDGHTASSSSQSGPYYDIFSLPRNAEAGGVASGTEAYYSFDYGNIHFVCLNSYDVDTSTSGAMLTWLKTDLAANDKEWLIAFWHHPPYSKGSHDSDSEGSLERMRENAVPILEDYGVDLVLSGHSHSYERSVLLDSHYGSSDTLSQGMVLDSGDGSESGDGAYNKSGAMVPHEGAVYTVAGSSGKASSAPLDHPAMIVSLEVLGSMVLDVEPGKLHAVFLDDSGQVRDDFSILHGPDIQPPRISNVQAPTATSVEVQFSETVQKNTAENTANYSIDKQVAISSATLQDSKTVLLSTSQHVDNQNYILTVNNIADTAGNTIANNSTASYTYSDLRTLDVSITSGDDDAEEASDGSMDLGSSDLELVDESSNQTVGIRFTNVKIPSGAAITNAYIQFTVDETDSGASALTIQGQASDNPSTFTSSSGNVSSRPRTNSSVSWSPPSWDSVGAAGAGQRTPNLSSILQEITARPGWTSGNSLVIIVTGSGTRTAESYNGSSSTAARLHIEYSAGGGSDTTPPGAPLNLRLAD